MKKKIFYWSPCLNPVGTVKSTLNSAIAAKKFGKNKYDVTLINAFGEWDQYLDFLKKNNIEIFNFKYRFYKYLPKKGFFQSRISYLIIYFFCFIPLLRLIKKSKPDYLISHLITSLPLTIMNLFNFDTKFILRISGMPKLNFIRRNFWKLISKKIFLVTCPSLELKSKLTNINLFKESKLHFLPDAIIDIKKFKIESREETGELQKFKNKKIIFSAGRLTKQKNFTYLIDEFSAFSETNKDFVLLILGDGEERKILEKKIIEKNLQDKVFLIGYVKNVYKFFKKGEIFILSSLWEEVGFVMVEAALSNLFIISSNCPNGPTEFLDNGQNGILFQNNKSGELTKSLKKYLNIENKKKHNYEIKKSTMKYSRLRHFIKLEEILK
jgi:glycosyltransferase involved in cell wall biosynthesis